VLQRRRSGPRARHGGARQLHRGAPDRSAPGPIAKIIQDPKAVRIDPEKLSSAAALDDAIAEFSRFYLERREQEINFAGDDERKRENYTMSSPPGWR
jgi:hypothetical protein